MSWETQGRQGHGWFGHGTAGGDGGPQARDVALKVAFSAIGHLPRSQRSRYEDWLNAGGIGQVAAVLPGWAAGSGLPVDRFWDVVLGPHDSLTTAGHAQAVGAALLPSRGEEGADAAAITQAGQRFADLVAAVRPEAMGSVMASAAARAETGAVVALVKRAAAPAHPAPHAPAAKPKAPAPAHPAPSAPAAKPKAPAHPTPHAPAAKPKAPTPTRPASPAPTAKPNTPATVPQDPEKLEKQNIEDLARVIYNEARGHGRDAMTAVGWTLKNRMTMNGVKAVQEAWGGYNHKSVDAAEGGDIAALDLAREIAAGIMNGKTPDPTGGATHFYSPQTMTKKGGKPSADQARGGLENVPGVVDEHSAERVKPHVKNYRPSWSSTFDEKIVPNIPSFNYKFYKQNDGKRVQ